MNPAMKVLLAAASILVLLGTVHPSPPVTPELAEIPEGGYAVLMYHKVHGPGCMEPWIEEWDITLARFLEHLDYLLDNGYAFITFHDINQENYDPSGKNVILTFDDGSDTHFDVVRPALNERGIHGVFYVVAGSIGWEGVLDAGRIQTMIDEGHEIGSHMVSHLDLTELTVEEIEFQLFESKATLESMFEAPGGGPYEVVSCAYPYCEADDRVYTLLEENEWYAFGVDCDEDYNLWADLPARPFEINRFTVNLEFLIEQFF
ncbi:polysaccharide deacetylase family protein [Thermodesulfobacteriota bacterium]